MPNEPLWLPPDEVLEINRDAVEATGEPYQILDRGLLESALNRPYHHWAYEGEEDIVVLACKLLFGIAKNHPFQQGNKRTGFTAAVMFIETNGYSFVAPDWDELGVAVEDVIVGNIAEEEFVEMIRDYVIE